jgi:hypothetical protein
MKYVFCAMVFSFIVFLSACTSLASRSDSDFEWEVQTVDIGYQEAYRNLREGFRRCDIYDITAELYTDTKKGFIEISAKRLVNAGPRVDIGVIYIDSKNESQSQVRVGKLMLGYRLPKFAAAFSRRDYSLCR